MSKHVGCNGLHMSKKGIFSIKSSAQDLGNIMISLNAMKTIYDTICLVIDEKISRIKCLSVLKI